MRVFKLSFLVVVLFAWAGVSQLNPSSSKSLIETQRPQLPVVISHKDRPSLDSASASVTIRRYLLDSGQSKFVARAFSGGLLWFKGHDHMNRADNVGWSQTPTRSGEHTSVLQ